MEAELFILSATDAASLEARAQALAPVARALSGEALIALARSTQLEAHSGLERLAVVAADGATLERALRDSGGGRGRARPGRPVIYAFPGLGDQAVEMGLELYQRVPAFRAAIDHAARILEPELRLDLRTVLYPRGTAAAPAEKSGGLDLRRMLGRASAEAPPSPLGETWLLQPIMFAVEHALVEMWRALGVEPSAVLGYSLGEYVAAATAGVMGVDDALRLCARRARLIHALPPGAMLAVSAAEAEVEALLPAELSISAANGPTMTVVAGPEAAVERFAASLAERQVVARRVQTSHAFHSRMMAPLAAPVEALLQGLALSPPRLSYVSNLTGRVMSAAEAADPRYWGRHLVERVRFADGVRAAWPSAEAVLLELGPGQALRSLALLCTAGQEGEARLALPSMPHAFEGKSERQVLLETLGRLFVAGVEVRWAQIPARAEGAAAVAPPAPEQPAPAHPGPDAIAERVAALMAELLGQPAVGLDQDFLVLGGNSLLAGQLVFKLRKAYRVTLPMRAIFESSTPRGLAERLRAELGEAPLQAGLRRLPNGLLIAEQSRQETDYFYQDIFEAASYLRHGLRLDPGAVVLDVGANIGLFSLFAAGRAPGAQIHAFEPAPSTYALLEQNLARNAPNARPQRIGLGAESGTRRFTYYPEASGMSSFHADYADERAVLSTVVGNELAKSGRRLAEDTQSAEAYFRQRLEPTVLEAEVRTLGQVMDQLGLDRIDFLKIDVQKAEREVLAGLPAERFAQVRQIAMEAHDLDGRVAELAALLEARGFRVHVEQDELYRGSNVHLLYARRRGEEE